MCKNVKKFFKRKSDCEKQSINFRIQGTGALCLRVALINFFNWIVENNLFNIVKISIIPYDEINCEAPKEIAEEGNHKELMMKNGIYKNFVFHQANLENIYDELERKNIDLYETDDENTKEIEVI